MEDCPLCGLNVSSGLRKALEIVVGRASSMASER